MSATVSTLTDIACDGGCGTEIVGRILNETANDIRLALRARGWHVHNPQGLEGLDGGSWPRRDYCPDCYCKRSWCRK